MADRFPTKFVKNMKHVVLEDGGLHFPVEVLEDEGDTIEGRVHVCDVLGNMATAPIENLSVMCAWFLRCENTATHTQSHPVLGDVPICDRCQGWYDSH